jgi:3-oxoacyl-(acyl-carrier-protein) synthase/SAM-dependent methyltransferase/acyl carrier protein
MKNLNLSSLRAGNDTAVHIEEIETQEIAIIGMAGAVADAKNIKDIWTFLENGRDCIREFPEGRRADMDRYLRFGNSGPADFRYRNGGYLEDIDQFDYEFFRLSPAEARLMDPHQRLFLQTVWQAIEDAGYGGQKITGTQTGIYLGYNADSPFDYLRMILDTEPEAVSMAVPGNISSMIASRIAYLLDLKGPSMVIDTACSAALVALHLACQGIRSGDCEMALVGSCRINFLPLVRDQKLGIESSDGRTRAFDESSDGTGMGEGVLAVLLKPLSKALLDRDAIYAVIKGSAINQDGSSVGITAPNVAAQEAVITKAWQAAGVDPETITYIEAHGTGTKLGDPIEIDGLTRAFRRYTSKKQFCAIGSIKSNIGHLDNAAGLAGLVKAALSLKHRQIPPTLHFQRPNPQIDFRESPLYVNVSLAPWETNGMRRRCGVSAFGLSGTNCHVILEEAPPVTNQAVLSTRPQVLVLSAKKMAGLRRLITGYLEFLNENDTIRLVDLCYTAATGRGHYSYRLALLVKDLADLQTKLTRLTQSEPAQINDPEIFHTLPADPGGQPPRNTNTEQTKLNQTASQKLQQWLADPRETGGMMELCQLYVQGAEVPWEELYRNEIPYKINLPVYPFDTRRCWLEIPEAGDVATASPVSQIIQLPAGEPPLFDDILPSLDNLLKTQFEVNGDLMLDLAGFEEYGLLLLLQSFQAMRLFVTPGESYDPEELKCRIGVIPKLNRFYDAIIDIMIRGKLLAMAGTRITATPRVSHPDTLQKLADLDRLRGELIKNFPDLLPYVRLVETCIRSYPSVLPGKVPGTSVMFPNASTELVEEIYRDTKNGAYCNELAAWCMRKALSLWEERCKPPRKFRILEVGAGTGGTSVGVLKELQSCGGNLEYYFTDISPSLVERGREIYGREYSFMHFHKFDLEKEPDMDGFDTGSFDMILAANVIHATRNIRQTLQRLKRLLKAGGLLILIEGTKPQDFGTLTMGMLDGWWLYEDEELRMKHSPLLDLESWGMVLATAGFGRVRFVENEKCFQSLLMAESDGIVTLHPGPDRAAISPEILSRSGRTSSGTENPRAVLTGHPGNRYSVNEQMVADVWSEVLGFETLRITDNLYELGGDSIIAMRITNTLEKEYGLKIEVAEALKHQTIESFAKFLDTRGQDEPSSHIPPLVPAAPRDYYPATAEQKRIFVADKIGNAGTGFNIPGAVMIEGSLDVSRLTGAFQQLLTRHETLRTSFAIINGEPVQRIHPDVPLDMEYLELDEAEISRRVQSYIRPFALDHAPLLRVTLIKLSEHKHLLWFDMHHIVSDGASIGVFIHDLVNLYGGKELPELKIQYKDFAVWQQEFFQSEGFRKQNEFWKRLFQDRVPRLNLPNDFPRPAIRGFAGDSLNFTADPRITAGLNQLALKTGATLYMVLLAAYAVLLARYSGQDDLVIGSPVSGRGHADLEPVIGMFINFVPIRLFPKGEKPFRDFLGEVKEMALKTYQNQDYQFQALVNQLDLEKDLSRNPLFDVVFALQRNVTEIQMADLCFTPYELENKVARFDMVLHATESGARLVFVLEYCSQLFAPGTIARISKDYVKILAQIIADDSIKVNELKLEHSYRPLVAPVNEAVKFDFS